MSDTIRIISERRYKAGYVIREEEVPSLAGGSYPKTMVMKICYTLEGLYIGRPPWGYRLCVKRGIKPELAGTNSDMCSDNPPCSIGFSERDQKWYGWSHRALHGFQIGDVVKEGDCTASSGWTQEYLAEHPEADISLPVGFKAETLDDAKRMAIAFAESVG